MATASKTKASAIKLSGKYILTASGTQYCMQSKIPVREIRNHLGTMVNGFVWGNVQKDFLERFVTHGLLAGIEIDRLEFLTKRKDIMLLVSCIFEAILFKRFRPQLKARLRGRDRIQETIGRSLDPVQIHDAVQRNAKLIQVIRDELRQRAVRRIESRTDIGKEEKESRAASLNKLFGNIDDEIWFLLAIHKKGDAREEIESILLGMLLSCIDRMDLSEYVALIVMEFVQYAERAHFVNLAERDQMVRKNPGAVDQLLMDGNFRERLMERAEQNGEFIVFSIGFTGNPHDPTRPAHSTLGSPASRSTSRGCTRVRQSGPSNGGWYPRIS